MKPWSRRPLPTRPNSQANRTASRRRTRPAWLAPPEPPARGEARRDKALLDLVPVGVLIYRLDRLLYANPAFLTQMGYADLHALEDAGGLDALYVEPGVSNASSTSGTGTPVTISASQPEGQHTPPQAVDAHLHTISWDGGFRAGADLFGPASSQSCGRSRCDRGSARGRRNHRRSATPMPRNSALSSTPRPKAS